MRTFEVGKEYTTRSPYDHAYYNCAKIIKRTEKMVTIIDDIGREVRCKIKKDDYGNEYIMTTKTSVVFA